MSLIAREMLEVASTCPACEASALIYLANAVAELEAELDALNELFPGGISLPRESWQQKRAREEELDRQNGVMAIPNQNPLPKDEFFVVPKQDRRRG